MVALSEKITKPASASAARRVVRFMLELGFQQCVFEGDLEVIKALDNGNFSLTSVGHTVKDIRSISGLLQPMSLSYVGRQGNSVTHALAQRVKVFFFSLSLDKGCSTKYLLFCFFWFSSHSINCQWVWSLKEKRKKRTFNNESILKTNTSNFNFDRERKK